MSGAATTATLRRILLWRRREKGFDGFASHALGINLEGNGNEILLTRDRESEGGVRWVGGGSSRNLHGKSAFSGT